MFVDKILGAFGPDGTLIVAGADAFLEMRSELARRLLCADVQRSASWHSVATTDTLHDVHELRNVTIWYQVPQTIAGMQEHMRPDLPWAERHFLERVGREPVNPGVEHANWPYHAGRLELHQHDGKYDHNYMERYWPKKLLPFGYRFSTGDLDDVVDLLVRDPTTRQAYLPVWFPEDTGTRAGQRVPCSLGYHFMIRDGALHTQYVIRACEIYRHFANDLYLTARLSLWVATEYMERTHFATTVVLGQLTAHMANLHGLLGDSHQIREIASGALPH